MTVGSRRGRIVVPMKARLMHDDRDFDMRQALPRHADALVQDLELKTLLKAMAGEEKLAL